MTQVLLTYTYCDVTVTRPAVLSHYLICPRVNQASSGSTGLEVTSNTVTESMRVLFLDGKQRGCMRSTVVMDLTRVTPVTYFKQSSKTYVTSFQGRHLVCMQTDKEHVLRPLGIGPGAITHPVFLLGKSVSIGASAFEGVGKVSILRSLVASTYKPLKPESTFELFEQMTTQPVLSVLFHLYFQMIGFINVPLAYTSDTSVTDILYTAREQHKTLEQAKCDAAPSTLKAVQAAVCLTPVGEKPCFPGMDADSKMQCDPWPEKICALSCNELSFFDT